MFLSSSSIVHCGLSADTDAIILGEWRNNTARTGGLSAVVLIIK